MAPITKEQFFEYVDTLTVLELSQIIKEMEQRYGVSAAAAPAIAMAAMPAAGAAGAEAVQEKTEFAVELVAHGEKKIQVIKVVRELTGLGLKEAKDLVDGVPKLVKEGVSKEEAQKMKEKLEEAGAQVQIK